MPYCCAAVQTDQTPDAARVQTNYLHLKASAGSPFPFARARSDIQNGRKKLKIFKQPKFWSRNKILASGLGNTSENMMSLYPKISSLKFDFYFH
jgi:hypothetical protein